MRLIYCMLALVALLASAGCATGLAPRPVNPAAEPHFSGLFFWPADLDEIPVRASENASEPQAGTGSGEAVIAFIVDTLGVPTEVQATKSTDLAAARAAMAVVKTWRFKPGTKAGKPVRCAMMVPVVVEKRGTGVPDIDATLSKSEQKEIEAAISSRTGYVLDSVERESNDVVKVTLTSKQDRQKALLLFFVRRGGRWIEDTSKAEETEYMIP